LTNLTLSRALVGDDDRDDDYDRDKDPQLSRHDGTPFAPRASCFGTGDSHGATPARPRAGLAELTASTRQHP
jgi:hypothetical protein